MKLKTVDGIDIFYQKDISENEKAVVVIVTGIAENCLRYGYVTKKLNDAGYTVFRFDHRGQGQSSGKRGYIKNYQVFNTDTDLVVEKAIDYAKGKQVFMLGHSMGGFVTALYGITYKDKISGQILSGACTNSVDDVKGFRGYFFRFIGLFAPKFQIANDLNDKISRDKTVIEDYMNDQYNLKKYSLKMVIEFAVKGVNYLKNNFNKYNYPVLVLHGGDDQIVSKAFSEEFFEKIASKDKKLKIYDGLYHEIMNEPEKDEVISDIIKWLDEKNIK